MNLLIFHSPCEVPRREAADGSRILALGPTVSISSEIVGILLIFTLSDLETSVIAKVALSKGSSQQGKARLASVD